MPTATGVKARLEDEVVLDRVIATLVERPRTFSELYANCSLIEEPLPTFDQVEEALDILYAAGAIKEFNESRYGSRMRIFALKSEARTYRTCPDCKGTGRQPDVKRGMCWTCKGNGIYTPVLAKRAE